GRVRHGDGPSVTRPSRPHRPITKRAQHLEPGPSGPPPGAGCGSAPSCSRGSERSGQGPAPGPAGRPADGVTGTPMRIDVVDPSAYTPPYDHSLCGALGASGAEVRLMTSEFAYGSVPPPDHYVRRELFYRLALGRPGSRVRLTS